MEFKKLDFLRTPICGLQRRLEESWETKIAQLFCPTGKTARNAVCRPSFSAGSKATSRRTRRIQEIAEKIGRPALEIKSIGRVGAKKK